MDQKQSTDGDTRLLLMISSVHPVTNTTDDKPWQYKHMYPPPGMLNDLNFSKK